MTGDIHITEIFNSDKKSFYTKEILEKLPEWFGNEKALNEYVEAVKELPYFAAFSNADKCIGFFAVKTHYQHTGDIFVCGVHPKYQHKGVGKALYYVG